MKRPAITILVGLLAFLINEPSIQNKTNNPAKIEIPESFSRQKEEQVRFPREGIEEKLWDCDPIPTVHYSQNARFYQLRNNNYLIPRPVKNWGRKELLSTLQRAACMMYEQYGAPLLVYDLSQRNGGRIPRHGSHRTGRDADVGHYVINDKREYDNVFRPLKNRELSS